MPDNPNKSEKRLFIGIKIPARKELIKQYSKIKNAFTEDVIIWSTPENFHITLEFLGKTPTYYLNAIHMALKNTAANTPSFDIILNSVGVFGKKTPKVLWIGVKNNNDLNNLSKSLNNELFDLGIAEPVKEFNPHLTLGRIKRLQDKNNLEMVIDKNKNTTYMQSEVNAIHLYESLTLQTGPVYKIIGTYILKA